MLLCWSLLLCSASLGTLAKSTPHLPRHHVYDPAVPLRDSLPEPDNDLTAELDRRDRRAINPKPSDIFWVYPRLSPTNSKLVDEDLDTAGDHVFLSKIFNIKRRSKRGFPSSDDVSDADVSQWARKTAPKSDFITGREHKTSDGGDADAKNNEVEPGFRPRSSHQPLTNRDFGVDSREGERFRQPHRRIIYYANLPEITSRDRSSVYGPHHRRYEPVPAGPKYPRESSYEARGRSNSFDRPYERNYNLNYDHRYNYRPADQAHSYTIVDAEAPRSNTYDSPYPAGYQGLANNKYNKIPAPYRQGDYAPRLREPLGSQGASLVRNEPYRDYNPRQPAPWSVQIGTKLTVKDEGRPFRPEVGQRRFYVNSQEPARYNRVDRSRYDYST